MSIEEEAVVDEAPEAPAAEEAPAGEDCPACGAVNSMDGGACSVCGWVKHED